MIATRTNEHIAIRKVLMRYMADYTTSTSAPAGASFGFYAIHITDTNMVWLGETNSFKATLQRFKSNGKFSHCVEEAKARGAKLELWFLTQPQRFSAQKLEDELINLDRLAERKEHNLSGPGLLYCIRHDRSNDYFIVVDRVNTPPSTILSSYLTRLLKEDASSRNVLLNSFITEQVTDVINQSGFSIHLIDKFDDCDDAWLKRQIYIDECKYGRNLNWKNVA